MEKEDSLTCQHPSPMAGKFDASEELPDAALIPVNPCSSVVYWRCELMV
jgi:hypothetical protein